MRWTNFILHAATIYFKRVCDVTNIFDAHYRSISIYIYIVYVNLQMKDYQSISVLKSHRKL